MERMEQGFDVAIDPFYLKAKMYDFVSTKIKKGEDASDVLEAFEFVLGVLMEESNGR